MENRIKELRESKGMTVEDLANVVGCCTIEINDLESSAEVYASSKTLTKIASVLGTTVDELITPNMRASYMDLEEIADKVKALGYVAYCVAKDVNESVPTDENIVSIAGSLFEDALYNLSQQLYAIMEVSKATDK